MAGADEKGAGLPSWMLTRRAGTIAVLLFAAVSAPLAIHLLRTEPALQPIAIATGIVFLVAWLAVVFFKLTEDGKSQKLARDVLRALKLMEENSYKAVRPQRIGDCVAIPITVVMRGVPASRVVNLTEDSLEVELADVYNLAGRNDQEKALLNLMHGVLKDDRFVVQVREGGGKTHSGPTGLGVTVGMPGFGVDLAYTVGSMLEEAARRNVTVM